MLCCEQLIHGQSFMLHQIRKMIGLMVLIARGVISESIFDHVFSAQHRFAIPKAPACGLLLDRCHFRAYDDAAETDEQLRIVAGRSLTDGKAPAATATAPAPAAPPKGGVNTWEGVKRPTFIESYSKHESSIATFKQNRLYPEICDKFQFEDELLHWLQHTATPGLYGHELGAEAPQPSTVPFNKREKKNPKLSAASIASTASTASAAAAASGKPAYDDASYEATKERNKRQREKKDANRAAATKSNVSFGKSNVSFKSSAPVPTPTPTTPAAPASAAVATPTATATTTATTTPAVTTNTNTK